MPNWHNIRHRYDWQEFDELERTAEGRDTLAAWADKLAEHFIEAFERNPPSDGTLKLYPLWLWSGVPTYQAFKYLNKLPPSIAKLTEVGSLDLRRTNVSDLTPLAGLTSLNLLHLEDTRVSDISPLAGLTSLKSLTIAQTQITDLSPLAGLKSLQNVELKSIPALDHDLELKRISEIPNDETRAKALLAYLNSGDYRPLTHDEPEMRRADSDHSETETADAPIESPQPAWNDHTSRSSPNGHRERTANANTKSIRAEVADLKALLTANLEYDRRRKLQQRQIPRPHIFVDFEQLDDDAAENAKKLFERMVDLLGRFEESLQHDRPSDKSPKGILAEIFRLWFGQTDAEKMRDVKFVGTVGLGLLGGVFVGERFALGILGYGVSALVTRWFVGRTEDDGKSD